jgi:hypothetical protein
MAKVLVAYASKFGATHEVAERVASRLGERGLEVYLRAATRACSQEKEGGHFRGLPHKRLGQNDLTGVVLPTGLCTRIQGLR